MDKSNLPIKYWKQSDLEKTRKNTQRESYLRPAPQEAHCLGCTYNEICENPKPCKVLRFQPYIVYHILQALSAKGLVPKKISLKKPSGKIRIEIKGKRKLILSPSVFRNGRECKHNLGIVLAKNPEYKHLTTINASEKLLKNARESYCNCTVQEILKSGNFHEESQPQNILNEQNEIKLSYSKGKQITNENKNCKKLAKENLLETFFADFFGNFNRESY